MTKQGIDFRSKEKCLYFSYTLIHINFLIFVIILKLLPFRKLYIEIYANI